MQNGNAKISISQALQETVLARHPPFLHIPSAPSFWAIPAAVQTWGDVQKQYTPASLSSPAYIWQYFLMRKVLRPVSHTPQNYLPVGWRCCRRADMDVVLFALSEEDTRPKFLIPWLLTRLGYNLKTHLLRLFFFFLKQETNSFFSKSMHRPLSLGETLGLCLLYGEAALTQTQRLQRGTWLMPVSRVSYCWAPNNPLFKMGTFWIAFPDVSLSPPTPYGHQRNNSSGAQEF